MGELINRDHWNFSHNKASEADWTPGLREIFEYRDLGFKDSTKGDYVAHIVRANGKEQSDEVQHWHIHECDFQFVYVLEGWAEFEYAGEGVRRIEKGDCINQRPMIPHREIACSKDFAVLEIVSPADFKTKIVDGPEGTKEAAE
jgi:mannose-6-phosphate isomerase-like protein (cupin superfamily)